MTRRALPSLFSLAVTALAALSTPTHAQSSLSIIPNFAVRGISADGRHASGTYFPNTTTLGSQIAVWHADSGLEALPLPVGAARGVGNGISGDGRTVTGTYYTTTNSNAGYAIKQTSGQSAVNVSAYYTTSPLRGANGLLLSYDGSVVAAQSSGSGLRHTYVWENGEAQLVGQGSAPRAISADGRLLLGELGSFSSFVYTWTREGGRQPFPTLSGYRLNGAKGMSSSGNVFLTTASQTSTNGWSRVILWNNGTPTVFPVRSTLSYASDTAYVLSGDGRVVIGADTVSETEVQYYRWTEETGKVSLLEYWAQNGIVLPPTYTIDSIWAISHDGNTIAGMCSAPNPDNPLTLLGGGFVATVPTCTSIAPLVILVGISRTRPRRC